jgi:hypothetical protein
MMKKGGDPPPPLQVQIPLPHQQKQEQELADADNENLAGGVGSIAGTPSPSPSGMPGRGQRGWVADYFDDKDEDDGINERPKVCCFICI